MSAAARPRDPHARRQEGRSAPDRAAGRHHGRQAHGRAHSALPSAAAVARGRRPRAAAARLSHPRRASATVGRTGVEMEALVAVAAAALTLYDMLKAVDRGDGDRPRSACSRSAAAGAATTAAAETLMPCASSSRFTIRRSGRFRPREVDAHRAALPDDDVVDAREPDERRARVRRRRRRCSRRKMSAEEFALARSVALDSQLRRRRRPACCRPPSSRAPSSSRTRAACTATRSPSTRSRSSLALRRSCTRRAAAGDARLGAGRAVDGPGAPPLADTRMLVVGLGTIGARVAAHGAGPRDARHRRSAGRLDAPAPAGRRRRLRVRTRCTRRSRDADVVVLALPRTDETRALIGAAELARDEADGAARQRRARPARRRGRARRRARARPHRRRPASTRSSRSRCRPTIRSGDCRTC